MALYDEAGSMLRAHVAACVDGRLPDAPRLTDVRGLEIVFADRDCAVDVERLARIANCHDLPMTTQRLTRGDPICSVAARGANEDQVATLLAEGRRDVMAATRAIR